MNKDYIVDKVEHVFDEANDRWMYIEYNKQRKIIGLNFMQGDDYEFFKKSWCRNDQGLTEFYHQMLYTFPIEKASVSTQSFINKCMWSFHAAIAQREENPQ
jgi:hypothetical protein